MPNSYLFPHSDFLVCIDFIPSRQLVFCVRVFKYTFVLKSQDFEGRKLGSVAARTWQLSDIVASATRLSAENEEVLTAPC